MKNTEQRWMHISTGLLVERNRKPDNSANDYRTVTVTWDEPEYEDVGVVRWLTSDGKTFLLESIALVHQATLTEGQIVKRTGTYRRRKPEPEPEPEVERLTAKIAELKAAYDLYEAAETGPEYSFAHQRYVEAVKSLCEEMGDK